VGRLGFLAVILSASFGCGRMGFDDQITPIEQCSLALDPGTPRLNFNSQRAIQIIGGTDPVELAITGPATIDAVGVVSALASPGTAMITATDAGGCTAQTQLLIGGDSLWFVGGTGMAGAVTTTYRSDDDGITWTAAGALPDKRASGGLLVYHDTLWWLSGSDGVGARNEVFSSSDGVTWTFVGRTPKAVTNPGHAVFQDKMFVIGGAASPDTPNVYSSTDGATWTLEGALPMENHGGCAVVLGDTLYYIGGHSNPAGQLFDWVVTTANGKTWQEIGQLPAGREYAAAVVYQGSIIIAGGQDLSSTKTTSVISSSDGMTWTPLAALPVGRAFGAMTVVHDKIVTAGGSDGGAVWRGAPGTTWEAPATNFTSPKQGGRAVAFSAP
jgi:hypothetical protein